MATPFSRRAEIQFDDRVYTQDYRITTRVSTKLKGKNRCSAKVQVYNPELKTARAAIAKSGRRFLSVKIGHEDRLTEVFAGFAVPNGALIVPSNTDTILTVEATGFGTGASARAQPKAIKVDPGATLKALVDQLEAAFGVKLDLGELRTLGIDPALDIAQVGVASLFGSGFSFLGSFQDFLDEIETKSDFTYTVRAGRPTLVPKRRTQGSIGPVFSRENGTIIGSPAPKDKGKVRFKFFLTPELVAGFRFIVEDEFYGGVFRAESVVHSFDSGYSNECYTSVDAKPAPVATADGRAEIPPLPEPLRALGEGIGAAANFVAPYLNAPDPSED